jgi:hypothetical protein
MWISRKDAGDVLWCNYRRRYWYTWVQLERRLDLPPLLTFRSFRSLAVSVLAE